MRAGTHFIVVVDGYGRAGRFVLEAHKKRLRCVHIQSSPKLSMEDRATFFPRAFVANMVYEDNFDEIVRTLKRLSIKGIVSGSAAGTALADRLRAALDIPVQVEPRDTFNELR